jgi:hypothetical protein
MNHNQSEDQGKELPDFYMENGLYVFTEAYHIKRGSCCGNNCRHCPWKDIPNTIYPNKNIQ